MNRAEFHVADSCIGCGKCVLVCPGGVLSLGEDHKPRIKDFSEFGWIGHGCWRNRAFTRKDLKGFIMKI